MKSYIWGPYFWYLFHFITFNYDHEKIQIYKQFFNNIKYILPCPICRTHYSKFIDKYKPDKYLNSKDNFIKWMIDFHNIVNKGLKKKQINYSDALNLYKQYDISKFFKMFNLLLEDPVNENFYNYKLFFQYISYIFPCKKIRNQLFINYFQNQKYINNFNDLRYWLHINLNKIITNSYLIEYDSIIVDCFKFNYTEYYYNWKLCL